MLFWYWIPAAIGGYICPYVYNFILGYTAPTTHCKGVFLTVFGATILYIVQTLGAGIESAIKYKTWRIYQIWDVVSFLVLLVAVLVGYAIPRDKSTSEGMTDAMGAAMYMNALYIFLAAYFVCWLVLRWLFRPKVDAAITGA